MLPGAINTPEITGHIEANLNAPFIISGRINAKLSTWAAT